MKRFVFIGSVKVNGESTQPGRAFTETDAPNPQDAYGLSKHEAEQGLRQIAANTALTFNQHDLIALRTQQGVHALVPGLTGWAQVNGRDELPIPDKVKLDWGQIPINL